MLTLMLVRCRVRPICSAMPMNLHPSPCVTRNNSDSDSDSGSGSDSESDSDSASDSHTSIDEVCAGQDLFFQSILS